MKPTTLPSNIQHLSRATKNKALHELNDSLQLKLVRSEGCRGGLVSRANKIDGALTELISTESPSAHKGVNGSFICDTY